MQEHDLQALQQQDLSKRRVQEMSPAERAELLRRYSVFVDHFRVGDPPAPPKRIRKWTPGAAK